MNIWLFIYFALQVMSLGMSVAKHGEPKKGNENAWTSVLAILLIHLFLYMGGVYDLLIKN